jgi:hypothetical protein
MFDQKKFGKLILFIDRARQHHRSTMVKEIHKTKQGEAEASF